MLNFLHISNPADCEDGWRTYSSAPARDEILPSLKPVAKPPLTSIRLCFDIQSVTGLGPSSFQGTFPNYFLVWFGFFSPFFPSCCFSPSPPTLTLVGPHIETTWKLLPFKSLDKGNPPRWDGKRPFQVKLKETTLPCCVHLSKLIKTWELGFQTMPRSNC